MSDDGNRRVLVTGAHGFTGQYVTNVLERKGYAVHRLVRGHPDEAGEWRGDLTEPDQLADIVNKVMPAYVVHLAAWSYVASKEVDAFYRINAIGTTNLLDALVGLERSVEKIVVASSATVYGQPGERLLSEDLCPAPVNHYGCSKLAMEHIARTYADRLPIVITRPFNYTGPGQAGHFVVPKIVRHYARREPVLELGNIEVSRDFSDVRDVAAMYAGLLEANTDPATVNVCSGRAVSLRYILGACEELTGHCPEIRSEPAFVRSTEIRELVGDTQRLERMIGPLERRDFKVTLADMIRACEHDH